MRSTTQNIETPRDPVHYWYRISRGWRTQRIRGFGGKLSMYQAESCCGLPVAIATCSTPLINDAVFAEVTSSPLLSDLVIRAVTGCRSEPDCAALPKLRRRR